MKKITISPQKYIPERKMTIKPLEDVADDFDFVNQNDKNVPSYSIPSSSITTKNNEASKAGTNQSNSFIPLNLPTFQVKDNLDFSFTQTKT
jgi:hypothetical protein